MRLARIFLYAVLVSWLLVIAIPAAPALAATGSISLSTLSGPPGTAVSVSGSGFTVSTTYTVSFGGTNVVTGSVDASGILIPVSFAVPLRPRGAYAVTVTTLAPDTSNTATFTVTPVITLSSISGRVGDTIYVSGTGFGASTGITINFDTSAATTASTDPYGSFSSIILTIPSTSPGNHTITANDGVAASPAITFTVLPKLILSPNVQTAGSQVTMLGSGFTANSPISFYIDNVSVTASATTTSTKTEKAPISTIALP